MTINHDQFIPSFRIVLWDFLEKPWTSSAASSYAVLSLLIVLISTATFIISTFEVCFTSHVLSLSLSLFCFHFHFSMLQCTHIHRHLHHLNFGGLFQTTLLVLLSLSLFTFTFHRTHFHHNLHHLNFLCLFQTTSSDEYRLHLIDNKTHR